MKAKNNEDATPILLAALNGYRQIVRYLHDHGGGFHARTDVTGLVDESDKPPQDWANRII